MPTKLYLEVALHMNVMLLLLYRTSPRGRKLVVVEMLRIWKMKALVSFCSHPAVRRTTSKSNSSLIKCFTKQRLAGMEGGDKRWWMDVPVTWAD